MFEWVEFSDKYDSYRVTTLQLYIAMNIVIMLCRVVISSLFIVLLIRFSRYTYKIIQTITLIMRNDYSPALEPNETIIL